MLVSPGSLKEHFTQFVCCSLSGRKMMFSLIWLAVIWQVWISRNDTVFRGVPFVVEVAVDQIKLKTWEWLKSRSNQFTYSTFEWFSEPLMCLSVM